MPRYPQAQALLCGMDRQISQHLEQDILNGDQELNPTLKMDRQIDRGLRYYNGLLAVALPFGVCCYDSQIGLGQINSHPERKQKAHQTLRHQRWWLNKFLSPGTPDISATLPSALKMRYSYFR